MLEALARRRAFAACTAYNYRTDRCACFEKEHFYMCYTIIIINTNEIFFFLSIEKKNNHNKTMTFLDFVKQHGLGTIAFILATIAIVLTIQASNRVDKSVALMRAALNEPDAKKREGLLNPVLLRGKPPRRPKNRWNPTNRPVGRGHFARAKHFARHGVPRQRKGRR